MNKILKFLIRSLRTIDGQRGSANKMLNEMNKNSVKEYMEKYNRKEISESQRLRIVQANEHTVFRRVYLKYIIMKVRAKISFTALVKRM